MFLTDKNVSLTKSITRWFVVVEGMEGRSMKQRVLWVVIVILPTRRFNGTARVADRFKSQCQRIHIVGAAWSFVQLDKLDFHFYQKLLIDH